MFAVVMVLPSGAFITTSRVPARPDIYVSTPTRAPDDAKARRRVHQFGRHFVSLRTTSPSQSRNASLKSSPFKPVLPRPANPASCRGFSSALAPSSATNILKSVPC